MALPRSRPLTYLALPLVFLAALVSYLVALRPPSFPAKIRLGAGVHGGTWEELGEGLSALLEDRLPGVAVEDLRTAGSIDNVKRLERGELDLAFVQNDDPGGATVRLIAPLYDNVLHLVVRDGLSPPIRDVGDLRGHAVAIGAEDSGTAWAAEIILHHFGVGDGAVRLRHLDTEESFEAFDAGEVNAVFHFSGLPGRHPPLLLEGRPARLLSLGDPKEEGSALDGLRARHPGFDRAVIPRRTYGDQPPDPVGTVSVKTLLTCRADLDEHFVRKVTEAVYTGKGELAESHPVALQLDEACDASRIRFPLHPGAAAWRRREEPSFLLTWADALSLAFAIILAGISGIVGARQWIRRRRKSRIDVYYLEVEGVSKLLRQASRSELGELGKRLNDLRRRAFEDLVQERVAADESFRIFQAFLQAEMDAIRDRLRGTWEGKEE